MHQALVIKELRESAGLLAVSALAALFFLAVLTGFPLLPWMSTSTYSLPFVQDQLPSTLWLVGGGLAILLGLKQTAWEAGWGTYYFLLHRPVDRSRVFGLKLAVGVALVLGVSGLFVLFYALWAATPGTHDSPFFWSMTVPVWRQWLSLVALYLGAFLSGIRPARWFGTKLAPVVAAILVAMLVAHDPWFWFGLLALAAWTAAALLAIFHHVNERDY